MLPTRTKAKLLALTGLRWSLAVLVNTLLNLIDAIAIGQLIFPRTDSFFQLFSTDAICLYLVTTSTAQLLYPMMTSFGTAVTAGMMAESLPFTNAIAMGIKKGYLGRYPEQESLEGMMPTVLLGMIIHTLTIACFFFLLVFFKLEGVVKKCPKYVLLGAMGGIGLFLFKTALEQSGLRSIGLSLTGLLPALAVIWTKRRLPSPFLVPVTLIALIATFYLTVYLLGYTWSELREGGLLIHGPLSKVFPFHIYKYLSLKQVEWGLLWRSVPIILGSAVFGMLHLPINAPSFARSSKQPFRMNRELVANGVINMATSLVGLLPSYFIYTSSVLFLQAGADNKICSFLLAVSTGTSLWFAIPYIRFIPTCAVAFLLFYLGLELLVESVVEGWQLTTRREYSIVLMMMASMMIIGFAQGLLFGILLSTATTLYDMRTMGAGKVNPTPRVDIAQTWARLNVYSPAENAFLETMRSEILVMDLPGYYHFGNSDEIIKAIGQAVKISAPKFVVLDMRGTLRADLNMIEGIQEMVLSETFGLVSCTVCVTTCRRLVNVEKYSKGKLKVLPDLLDAIGWIDRLQLLELTIDYIEIAKSFEDHRPLDESASLLSIESGEPKQATRHMRRLEKARSRYMQVQRNETDLLDMIDSSSIETITSGGALWTAGETIEDVYIVESGSLEEFDPLVLHPIKRYHRGAWLGLEAIQKSQLTTTTCIAGKESKVRCIPSYAIQGLPQSSLHFLHHDF